MAKVLMYESTEMEGRLMEHALEFVSKDMRVQSLILGDIEPHSLIRQMTKQLILEGPDLIMINMDKRDESVSLNHVIQKIRNLPAFRHTFVLVWVNPLRNLPSWEMGFGPGCFEQKPFEFDALVHLLGQRWTESQSNQTGGN